MSGQLNKHRAKTMKKIFNQEGIANVRDLKEKVQVQYKGCGRGSVVMSQDGEVVSLRYNGVIPKDKIAQWEAEINAHKAAGHVFFSCDFSSGQILLDKQDVRNTLLEREDYNNERPMDEPSNPCFTTFNTFGIPDEFIIHENEISERYPSSNAQYHYRDGLYFSNDCPGGRFKLIITVEPE